MKKMTHLCVLLLCLIVNRSYAQADAATTGNGAKIIFMRSTGYTGSATAFTTFINDQLVCRLNNKRFSTHSVPPGKHSISVQFAGKNSKEKAERIIIEVEEGKTYYVQLIFQPGLLINNIYCQEVTKSSADLLLPKLKEDTKCI